MKTENIASHWINGEWIQTEDIKDSINPATYEIIGQYAEGGLAEADASIAAAKYAFSETSWRKDKNLRSEVIEKIAQRFEVYTNELIALLSLENGKIKPEATFEINMVPSKLRYYAALARTMKGESGQPKPGVFSMTIKEPVGVAGIIVPWNSPIVLAIRSIAPALATGCTVAVKMPGQTAQTNTLLAKIFSEVSELPKGVVNFFNELGGEGSKRLVSSPDTAVIGFTGSTFTGALIAQQAGKLLKRCSLELGGKSPHIVFEDANLDKLLPVLHKTVTTFAGQFCMAGSRLIVHNDIAEKVIASIANHFKTIRIGAAADPQSEMGPMISKQDVERVDQSVLEAIAAGAEVIVRGGPVTESTLSRGAFYQPTLLRVTNPDLDIVQKETFGPVMVVQTFETEAEAVLLANNSEFGLAASVWTPQNARAFRVAEQINAGTLWINDWAKVYDEFEEGGFKNSGLGRLNGPAALDDFLELKHITFSTLAVDI